MRRPPSFRSARWTVSAAGFIATRQSRRSPGVYTRRLPNWSWKLETPKRVPAGARISAGKFGSVEMSLPAHAASVVNCSPVTCIPSPESPAKRITARVSVRCGLARAAERPVESLMSVLSFPARRPPPPGREVHAVHPDPPRPSAPGAKPPRGPRPFRHWGKTAGGMTAPAMLSNLLERRKISTGRTIGPAGRLPGAQDLDEARDRRRQQLASPPDDTDRTGQPIHAQGHGAERPHADLEEHRRTRQDADPGRDADRPLDGLDVVELHHHL